MKLLIHVAVVEHQTGMDIHTAASEEALNAKLAAYCRSHWETISRQDEALPEIPETNDAIVARYFADHEDDTVSIDCDSVDLETAPAADFRDALSNPDHLGSAEYRALFELVVEAANLDQAITICEEMRSWAQAVGNILKRKQRP